MLLLAPTDLSPETTQEEGVDVGVTDDLPALPPPPVGGMIDWQGHPAMHVTWGFFAPGLTERSPHLTWNHPFKQVVHEPYLRRSEVRIFLAAAMAAEQARNPKQARAMILRGLRYVEDFVAEHPRDYAIAKSPEEVRRLLAETDKMVIVHSIEGGHLLFDAPEDAAYWASQGVALVTLMHLRDDELGGSALLPRKLGPLINPVGARRAKKGERRGLTEHGAETVRALGRAGVLVDLSHMHPDTIDDTLAVTKAEGMSPVVTHGTLHRVRAVEMSFRDDQVVEIYKQGGMFSLGLSGQLLDPIGTTPARFEGVCPGSLESFAAHYAELNALIAEHVAEIPGGTQAVRRAVGWSSDWNGWVPHSRPVYGPKGCKDLSTLSAPLTIDTEGLAHPGLLPEHWDALERDGAILSPIAYSAERFLQLWEAARTP